MSKTQYRFTGSHPQDFDVDGKVLMIEPGGTIDLDLQDENQKQYQYLADDGLLLDTSEKAKTPQAGGNK